jgi:hypothetical protein
MQEETKQQDVFSPEAYDVMRVVVTAIRIVKLYPPNNPVYSQSVKEAYEVLSRFLESTPEYYIGVQKSVFTCANIPVGKDTEANKAIANDLFSKGIRDITFRKGVSVKEMMDLFQALAMQTKEMAMQSGVSSILWEKGVSNIKVTEAGLDEIISAETGLSVEEMARKMTHAGVTDSSFKSKTGSFTGHTLVLDNLLVDQAGFAAAMIELAKETQKENETLEDRLLSLYQEAGRKIQEEHPDQSDAFYAKLAESVMSLEQPYRELLIAGKLYEGLDSENTKKQKTEIEDQVPSGLHEILTGRFLDSWTVQQVTELLKNLTTKEIVSPTPPLSSPSALSAISLLTDTGEIAKEIAQYTAEETEELKSMSSMGTESDIIDAAIRILVSIIPLVKSPHHAVPDNKEIALFAGVISQLEDMLNYLLSKKDYDRASLINNAFNLPVDPAFKPRMLEALRKNSSNSKTFITSTITDLQKYAKGSPEYVSAYSYVSAMPRETTEVLLEMLANENDNKSRSVIIDLLKDIGKNQIALLGERLSDSRSHFVLDIINILCETKSDQAIASLQKAMGHKNIKIRQEVLKGLISIGGKKAAGTLAKFFKDEDETVQMMAIRGFTEIKGISVQDTKPLITFLTDRNLNKKEQALTLEAIKALEKVGGPAAEELLKGYSKVKWWKSRKLQVELRDAALRAMAKIKRRQVNSGSAKR